MRALILIALLFCPINALAQGSPRPDHHPLKEAESALIREREQAKQLTREMGTIKGSLEDIRKKALKITKQVKQSEGALLILEKEIVRKENEKTAIKERLLKDKKSLSELTLALARLERLPPEAVLMKPGAPLETAQSSLILQSTLPRIYGRADSLKADLERLSAIVEGLEKNKQRALRKSAQLKEEQAELQNLLAEREKLYAKTEQNMVKTKAEIAFISKRAENLKDLVTKLDRYEQGKTQPAVAKQPVPKNPKNLPKLTGAQMPISGVIKTRFGDSDNIGAQSQGIHITGRGGGVVTAPLSGTVRFAGPFRNYGEMVIIEHENGYHSLLAGLGRIDTVEGRGVKTGEAVGILPAAGDGGAPNMYYELRYKGKPVNPGPFLGTS